MTTPPKIKYPLYTLRQVRGTGTQTACAKMDKDFGNTETYYLTEDVSKRVTCTCPSKYEPCKHAALLRQAKILNPDDWQSRYWHVAPKAAGIYSYTAEEVGIHV